MYFFSNYLPILAQKYIKSLNFEDHQSLSRTYSYYHYFIVSRKLLVASKFTSIVFSSITTP